MSDIPDELIREILLRLPVKSLLRFRCVSKSWRALIGSQDFIKKHLTHSLNTPSNSNHTLILRSFSYSSDLVTAEESSLHSADFDSLDRNEAHCTDFEVLKPPLESTDIKIFGSCNGLLCLLYDEVMIVLWNPSTREYRILPVAENEIPNGFGVSQQTVYGFGYDSANDDYKVFSILQITGLNEMYCEVKVYSLKSDSWKRVQDFPYYFDLRCGGKLTDGALHWVVDASWKSNTEQLITAFDLETEEYRLVPKPDNNFYMSVEVLGGCLCVVCDRFDCHFDIWVMKEYGVKESWNNLISVEAYGMGDGFYPFVRPIAYSKCGRRVLLGQDDHLLMWYDLDSKSVSYPDTKVPSAEEFRDLDIFVQGLVKLNVGSA